MRFLFLLILGLVASCKPTDPPAQSKFLNIDSLFGSQVKINPIASIEKTIQVNDSVFRYKSDSMRLDKELEPFQELNLINRSIYRDSYQLSIQPDTRSNLTVQVWTATQDAPVKLLKLFYLDKPNRLKRMEAELSTNDLYTQSSKKLHLDFNILSDTIRLETFSISGQQCYFWGDPQYFSVDAMIQR